MALLRKPDAIKVEVPVRYLGFDIPNEFVVGYGLDYAERYRDLPYIARLSPRSTAGEQGTPDARLGRFPGSGPPAAGALRHP